MHILDKIVAFKKKEVADAKLQCPIKSLEASTYFKRKVYSLKESIKNESKSGVIAEFKRKSPSKNAINLDALVTQVVPEYEKAGASGVSILTDAEFFGGQNHFITEVRPLTHIPILRKEFIIDEYQIIEAKSIGADAILLIARILSKNEIQSFSDLGHSLGLEVLLEVHNQEELDKITLDADVIGINNRDLDTFKVDYENSKRLLNQLPQELCKISESGIHDVEVMLELKQAGFDGFLMGERFMQVDKPGLACQTMLAEYSNALKNRS